MVCGLFFCILYFYRGCYFLYLKIKVFLAIYIIVFILMTVGPIISFVLRIIKLWRFLFQNCGHFCRATWNFTNTSISQSIIWTIWLVAVFCGISFYNRGYNTRRKIKFVQVNWCLMAWFIFWNSLTMFSILRHSIKRVSASKRTTLTLVF